MFIIKDEDVACMSLRQKFEMDLNKNIQAEEFEKDEALLREIVKEQIKRNLL